MAWRYRFLAARRSQHGRVHPAHWLISTQVDGGIKATPETIGACAAAGANCFIAGSGLFAYDDMSQAVPST